MLTAHEYCSQPVATSCMWALSIALVHSWTRHTFGGSKNRRNSMVAMGCDGLRWVASFVVHSAPWCSAPHKALAAELSAQSTKLNTVDQPLPLKRPRPMFQCPCCAADANSWQRAWGSALS